MDNQGSRTCAQGGVPKEYKTHARPELYASTPLEALKVVLRSPRANEKEKWQGLTCGGRTSTLRHERKVFELRARTSALR